MDTEMELGNRKGRPNYPAEFKYQLAVAACAPGVSVSRLAQDHCINTNMLFKWRRDLRAGRLVGPAADGATLLPVVLKPSTPPVQLASSAGRASAIEISIADATIRVSPDTDAALLRLVLQTVVVNKVVASLHAASFDISGAARSGLSHTSVVV